jgi:NAD-dependent DNA ligase
MEPNIAKEWLEVLKDAISIFKPSQKEIKVASAPKHKGKKPKINLKGKVVVVTGTVSMHRSDFQEWLTRSGASLGNSVTKNTDFLIVGMKPGEKKIHDAKSKGIPIISWKQFTARI